MQYCSFKNSDPRGVVDSAGALPCAGPEAVVTHLPLHAPGSNPVAAGTTAFLKHLLEDRLMKSVSMLRGEERQSGPYAAGLRERRVETIGGLDLHRPSGPLHASGREWQSAPSASHRILV